MKYSSFKGLLAAGLAITAAGAYADSAISNQPQDQNQAQNQNKDQAQEQTYDQNVSGQQAGVAGTDATLKNDVQAKKTIGPQSVMLQSSLMSAKAQLEGLKSQVALAESAKPDAGFLNQVKTYDRSIDNTIKDAANHESRIKSGLLKTYPQIASGDNAKSLDYSVNDLQSFFKSWSTKAKDRTYWQDKDQAKADLDSLDKRLDKAIDQSKTFNSDQFDISVG